MATTTITESARIRAQLDHPVIDGDGHCPQEQMPDLYATMRDLVGPRLADALRSLFEQGVRDEHASSDFAGFVNPTWGLVGDEERRERREYKPPWGEARRAERDYDAARDERVFYERLDEFGIDFAVVYPNLALSFAHIDDEELRRAACRALNTYNARRFGPYADRMTPVASIPMHTPAEAIAELEHAVDVLGLKAILIPGFVTRPIRSLEKLDPRLGKYARWLDMYGLDSEHDYDPFWAKCVEYGVAPTQHSSAVASPFGAHRSISNYQYNQINCFADVNHALCKAVFMGGVTRRFPTLKFGFLEGGVGWACQLYADMVGRWPKRHPNALRRREGRDVGTIDVVDEWSACELTSVEDIRDLFVTNFYFGCEADDPMNALAFSDINPLGAQLKAFMGSDLGHWDVPDMTTVIAEAYEMVEHGQLDDAQLRAFLYTNPARLFGESNPAFFRGTVVESDVQRLFAGADA